MKHIITILAIALASITLSANVYGQEDHMKFKGIPITGHVDDFTQKLIDMGYTYEETNDLGQVSLSGPFADYNEVTITLISSKKTKTVWRVIVKVKEKFIEEYDHIRKYYVAKYGEDYEKDKLGSEIDYYTWKFDNGTVFIHADKNIKSYQLGIDLYDICLYYDDETNGNLSVKEKEDTIYGDI